MTVEGSMADRRFYRDKDRAWLGGVCAGIADYFGFNLKVTRVLACIAFFMAMPMAVLAYVAVVLLVPAKSLHGREQTTDPEFTRALRASPQQTMNDVRRRFKSLDRRLARLEKYVTSSRYQLDQEFKRL